MSTRPDLTEILDSPDLVQMYDHLRAGHSHELAMEVIALFKQVKRLQRQVETLFEEVARVRADISRKHGNLLRE